MAMAVCGTNCSICPAISHSLRFAHEAVLSLPHYAAVAVDCTMSKLGPWKRLCISPRAAYADASSPCDLHLILAIFLSQPLCDRAMAVSCRESARVPGVVLVLAGLARDRAAAGVAVLVLTLVAPVVVLSPQARAAAPERPARQLSTDSGLRPCGIHQGHGAAFNGTSGWQTQAGVALDMTGNTRVRHSAQSPDVRYDTQTPHAGNRHLHGQQDAGPVGCCAGQRHLQRHSGRRRPHVSQLPRCDHGTAGRSERHHGHRPVYPHRARRSGRR